VPPLESCGGPPNAPVRPYKRGSGAQLPAESRGRAPGQKGRGQSPLKLKHFRLFDVQWKPQICALFKIWNAKKTDTIGVVFAKNEVSYAAIHHRLPYINKN